MFILLEDTSSAIVWRETSGERNLVAYGSMLSFDCNRDN